MYSTLLNFGDSRVLTVVKYSPTTSMQINNRFDQSNYLKHNPIIVYNDAWVKSPIEFKSSLLLIKWVSLNKLSPSGNRDGLIEQNIVTSIGSMPPQSYKVTLYDKEYIQFLNILTSDIPYSLKFKNPSSTNRSKLEIWEYIHSPTITNNFMPWQSSESSTPQDPQAMIAAAVANTAAITALGTAITAQPQAIANALNKGDLIVQTPVTYTVGTVPSQILVANDNNQGCLINNEGTTKIKLWIQDAPLASTTGYASSGSMFEMPGKGLYEVPTAYAKSSIWAISNGNNGIVSVTRSTAV